MGDEVWLMGVYRGELVTVNEHYKKEFWDKLIELRKGKFLGYNIKRNKLAPYFFFLKPADGAKRLGDIESATRLEDYGLAGIAYESLDDGTHTPPRYMMPAKGRREGRLFFSDNTPAGIIASIKGQGIATLALCDETLETPGVVRTGTFFSYEATGSSIAFKPLMHQNRYIAGKGILVGAWSGSAYKFGGMIQHQYKREKRCPLNIGSAYFKRKGFGFYITYRSVETDLRLDMPAALLYLAKAGGIKHLAKNLGASLNYAFGKYIEQIFLRDTLADGNIVDYEDITPLSGLDFDIRKDTEKLKGLTLSVFKTLYLCTAASIYHGKGLKSVLDLDKCLGFTRKNYTAINERYQALCDEFLSGLSKENRIYFSGQHKKEILSIRDMDRLFTEATGWELQVTSQK